MTYKSNIEMLPAQKESLERALEKGRYGIFFEQRVGKTRVAIEFAGHKCVEENLKRILIVTTLAGKHEWYKEFNNVWKQSNVPYYEVITASECLTKEIPKFYSNNTIQVLIVTYDRLNSIEDKKAINKFNPELIVADECQFIKNRKSLRSKTLGKLGQKAKYTLGLTGTPISNKSLQDAFGIFRFINPELFGTRWADFETRYCIMGGYMGKDVVDYRDKEEILEIINDNSMRVERKDVMKEPKSNVKLITCTMSKENLLEYKTLEKKAILELENSTKIVASNIASQQIKLQQFSGGFVKVSDDEYKCVNVAKLALIRDLTNKLINKHNEPFILCCKFLHEIRAIVSVLNTAFPQITVDVITGSVKEKDRIEIINRVNVGITQVLIVQERSVSTAIDLSKLRTMVFYSFSEDSVNNSQLRDRIMGRNQKSDQVNYFYLVTEKTIDLKIYKQLTHKTTRASKLANWRKWLIAEEEVEENEKM